MKFSNQGQDFARVVAMIMWKILTSPHACISYAEEQCLELQRQTRELQDALNIRSKEVEALKEIAAESSGDDSQSAQKVIELSKKVGATSVEKSGDGWHGLYTACSCILYYILNEKHDDWNVVTTISSHVV